MPCSLLRARARGAGRCQCRAVRAWLPPPSLWLFAPREESHATGGWSFEFRKSGNGNGKTNAHGGDALHPAVVVLCAAFHSLDRERGRRSGLRGALTWLGRRIGLPLT